MIIITKIEEKPNNKIIIFGKISSKSRNKQRLANLAPTHTHTNMWLLFFHQTKKAKILQTSFIEKVSEENSSSLKILSFERKYKRNK